MYGSPPMDILVVTSEVASYSGKGGVAEVAAALPKALKGLDHKVLVVSPLWRGIDPSARSLARRLTKLEVRLGDEDLACEIYDGRTAGGVDLAFIGHEEVLHRSDAMESPGDAPEDVARRAGLFAKAVVELVRLRGADVVHAHGWVGALAVLQLATHEATANTATVLTVHDPASQGRFDPALAAALGVDGERQQDVTHGDALVALSGGLRRAGRVTTVSPTFAKEITSAPDGAGLEELFADLGDRLVGILNGLDYSVWNPATDARLPARFDPMDLGGKGRCKADLQRKTGLPVRGDVPLLGMLANGHEDAGFDLFAKITPQVMRNDCQVVVAWEDAPDAELAGIFRELSERWPDRLQVVVDGSDDTLRHRVLGACDLVLLPSRRSPCGFDQMRAHRYGTLPVARRTGGLADAIIDCDPKLRTGTGFLFDEATAEDLLAGVRRALGAFEMDEPFDVLRRRVMTIDHSWERGARLYDRTYRAALNL